MKILLVEDDISTRKLQNMMLTRAGYDVVEAENGKIALETLEYNVVDIIVLDILMPEMTGIEVLRCLKKDPTTRNIPTILCTSVSEHEQVKEAMTLGIIGYILKPIVARDLLQKIKSAIKTVDPILEEPTKVIYRLGLDVSGFKELLNVMIDDARTKIKQIGTKVEGGDFSEFDKFARDLSTSAGNLGACALKNVALNAKEALPLAEPEKRGKYFFKIKFELDRLEEKASEMKYMKKASSLF